MFGRSLYLLYNFGIIIVILNHLHSKGSVRKLGGLTAVKMRNEIRILMRKEKK